MKSHPLLYSILRKTFIASLAAAGILLCGSSGYAQPTVGAVNVAGIMLCTNTEMTCTVSASSPTTPITNIVLSYTTTLLGGTGANSVTTNVNKQTTGLGTATATFTYPLVTNVIYTELTVTALDDTGASGATNGLVANAPEVLDTLQPTLIIEAEDYNYTNGAYMNTPPDGGLALYQGLVGVAGIDFQWAKDLGTPNYYRPADSAGGFGPQCETTGDDVGLMPQKFWTAIANGDTTDVPTEIGYNSGGNWLDYTRDFGPAATNSAPAGTYNIWVFLSDDDTSDPSVTLSTVTSSATTSNQTTSATIGNFNLTDADWNNYFYTPMLDQYGNLVAVTLSGHETLRGTVVGEANIDFYMLVPAVPVVKPILLHSYPDGNHPFELTNTFSFAVGAANGAGIPESGVSLAINGENVTSGVNLTGGTNAWSGTFPITANTLYTATITASNSAGLISTFSYSFDTFSLTNYQFEAVDYDYSTNSAGTNSTPVWVSGLSIQNAVPTGDSASNTGALVGKEETNSYFGYPGGIIPSSDNGSNGASAQMNIDFYYQNTGGEVAYRADGEGSQPAGDWLRPMFAAAQTEFKDPNITEFNIGWTTAGDWQNYTRNFPTGHFAIYARIAGNSAWSGSQMAMVTSGVGTANQTLNVLGSFADPNAAGWQSYHWIPCVDSSGVPVNVELGGKATLRFMCGGGVNDLYYMLVPFEPPTVPVLVSSYPDGSHPFEGTNVYSFEVTSASGAAISSNGISVVLNGVNVDAQLTESSSTTNWTVSLPLTPNTLYNSVISVTNGAGLVSTFYKSFDTFSVSNYTWEANDYDFTVTNGTTVTSGQFIDNPIPSCDTTGPLQGELETNSYFSYPGDHPGSSGALQMVDFYCQTIETPGGANDYYRLDGQGSAPSGDYVRPKFIAARTALGDGNIGPFQEGYTSTHDWGNYTRHYPAGNYYVYGRIAGNSAWSGTEIAEVTSGVGTAIQTSNVLGSFADPNANGWESFHWVPLLSTNTGAPAVVTFTGAATTLKVICGGGVNEAYYMLVPAPAQLSPTIGASLVAGQLSITVPTVTGHNYQLIYSSVLTTNNSAWTPVGTAIVGDGTVHTVSETLTGAQGYYAIKVE